MLTWWWTSPASLRTRPLRPLKLPSSSSSSPRTSRASTDTRSLLFVARRNGVGIYTSMLMILLLAFLERHAEIALASIAQHCHDDPVRRQRFGDAAGRPDVGAGRDADQQPFLPRQAPGRRGGVLVTDQHDLVEDGAVEHARHEGCPD